MAENDREARLWAVETFGDVGLSLRRTIPVVMNAVHRAHAIGHWTIASELRKEPSRRGYGGLWAELLEAVADLRKEIPGAEVQTKHPLLRVGSVLIFPVRCTHRTANGYKLRTISARRIALFNGELHEEPTLFTLDRPAHPTEHFTDEELEIIADYNLLRDSARQGQLVVAVAMVSTPDGLISLEWGPATLGEHGELVMSGFREDLRWAIGPAASVAGHAASQQDTGRAGKGSTVARAVGDYEPGVTPDDPGTVPDPSQGGGRPVHLHLGRTGASADAAPRSP